MFSSNDVPAAQIHELLEGVFIFQGLTKAEIRAISSYFATLTVDKHAVLYREGERGKGFFIILEGSVRTSRLERQQDAASRQVNKTESVLNNLSPGDYFGEENLAGEPCLSTARAQEACTLIYLGPAQAQLLLETYPVVAKTVRDTAETRHLVARHKFPWIKPEEMVYFIGRRHSFFLIMSLIPSAVLALSAIPIAVSSIMARQGTASSSIGLPAAMIIFLVGLGWAVWKWLDWANDYFIVTSRRLVWLEKIIILYDRRTESPLNQIREAHVYASFWGRIIGFGDVTANTYIGKIVMRRANHPKLIEKAMINYRSRYTRVTNEAETKALSEKMEKALRSRFGMDQLSGEAPGSFSPGFAKTPITQSGEQTSAPAPGEPSTDTSSVLRLWLEKFSDLRHTFKFRYERNGEITYRKHWLILLRKIGPATGLLLITLLVDLGTFFWGIPATLCLPSGLVGLVFFGLAVYHFLDWNNDIYRLTPRQILDIERKPLREETRKTANLEDIQSIVHNRENILELLLDFGKVTVNVAAGNPFNFYGVPHPADIHIDISNYQENLRSAKREREVDLERDRIVGWMITYNETLDKLEKEKNPPNPMNQE